MCSFASKFQKKLSCVTLILVVTALQGKTPSHYHIPALFLILVTSTEAPLWVLLISGQVMLDTVVTILSAI